VYISRDPEAKYGGIISAVYLEFLEDKLPILWELGLVFMQDNASIYTACIVKDWLKEQRIEVLNWSLYSPDLNPIEYTWKRLKK
jgi:transposase